MLHQLSKTFVDSNKKLKQRQPHTLKAVVVDLGAEGITYSVILHSDTVSGDMCKNPHLNVSFGPHYLAFYDVSFSKPLFPYIDN